MLASGQMASDLQKDFIKRNLYRRKHEPEKPAEETQRDVTPQPLPKTKPPPQEEHFKHVGKDLKLNQSAMLPEKQNNANQKLEDLADKADITLLRVSTVFPFTFFTHDIIIDPYKVNIIFRKFFWSEHIHSIMVKDILDVVVETSIFFATIRIVDQGYVENSVDIAYLKKADALKVRKIIQGLVIAHRQAVDLSVLTPSNIRDKSEELGQVKGIDDTKENLKSR